MRATLLVSFALAWISSCVGCGTVRSANLPHRDMAASLQAETVALVKLVDSEGKDDENGAPALYCAGVWISKTEILTAGHCFDLLKPEPRKAAEALAEILGALGADFQLPAWDPVGHEVLFSLRGELPLHAARSYWTGHVEAVSRRFDLGLVSVDSPPPMHPSARLSAGETLPGDRVEVVGHPATHGWSYVEGLVSAVIPDEPNANGIPMPTLQLELPISGGNSGGGAFDAAGELVGIASYTEMHTAGMGYFVPVNAIQAFLGGKS